MSLTECKCYRRINATVSELPWDGPDIIKIKVKTILLIILLIIANLCWRLYSECYGHRFDLGWPCTGARNNKRYVIDLVLSLKSQTYFMLSKPRLYRYFKW